MTEKTDSANEGSRHAEPARLEYGGIVIHQKEETLSLTDMWRAARQNAVENGAVPSEFDARQPAEWLRSADAKKFIDVLSEVLDMGNSQDQKLVHITRGGRGGSNSSTRAHWQIGLAYAKYLSPEFHMWCNTVVRERMEGRPVPTVSNEIVRAFNDLKAQVLAVAGNQAALERRVNDALEGHDPTQMAITGFAPMLTMLEQRNVPQKGRGGLVRKCSNRLAKWCRRIKRENAMRPSKDRGVRLFEIELAGEWFKAVGNDLIRAHNDKMAGQTVMQFRSKPTVVPPSAPSEGASA